MKYTHYEDGGRIEPNAFVSPSQGTWRSYRHVSNFGWVAIKGSMKGTEMESRNFAGDRFPRAWIKTVYHSDGDERD